MMTVPMDSSASESRELAQRLFTKNIELENGLRKSAQSKVPSDPNAWNQMRENYEAIVLEDHDFSEKHEVEYALWQLHYRRIEEFRAHINGAISAGGSVTAPGGKGTARPERIKKILSVFKSFLSEATGFYHDLLLKIKAKYGLPLVYISESHQNGVVLAKDEKKSSEMKKGLLSCHRCLIYLGDLSRYKGLYGEADSSRDFAAASSYYVQAASLWPSNGNPHHQLAILASYSGDELVVLYRYFRSLAVNTPFSTARDNLIIAFEKNRQSYSQLPGNAKVTPATKVLPTRMNGGRGRGRGRGDTRLLTKDTKTEFTQAKGGRELSVPETFKAFSTRFVRLNGILFTRTSLETFDEVLSLILNILRDLLSSVSSGPKEDLNFGQDATENGLVFVRFIAILIFSVHNVYRESEGQSYAEILQRAVVLQNAFSAAFEFVGYILKRCIELDDVASSYLLPAILVFMEWLACHPDIATRNDVEEKEAGARSFFWKQCVSLINILMGSGLVSIGGNDDDTSCFSDMSVYDEGETGNRLALWEDIELRGFSPLVPAHLILDFSRKHPSGNDGSNEEKKARVNRILAAGRTLVHEVMIDHQGVYYDCSLKKFVIGTKPATYDDCAHTFDASKPSDVKQTSPGGKTGIAQFNKMNLEGTQLKEQVFAEGEEDDEEIVFQPSVTEKYPSLGVSKSNLYDSIHPVQHYSGGDLLPYADSFSTAVENLRLPSAHKASPQLHAAVPSVSLPPPENLALRKSNYFIEQELSFANGLKNMNIAGSGFCANPVQELPNGLQYMAPLSFSSTAVNSTPNITMPYQNNVAESTIPSKLDSIVSSGPNHTDLSMKSSVPFPATSRKNPVSRPVRHLGPPPGFGHGPSNKMADSFSKLVLNGQLPPMDDYRWLDGYQTPSTKGNGFDNFQNYNSHIHAQFATSNNNGFNDALSFPFPGKQSPMVPAEAANGKKWQELNLPENLKVYSEQQLPRGNQQPALLPEQYQAQSLWSSQYFV